MSLLDAPASADAEVRAGSRVLSIFENPLNTRILRAHADGPKRLAELQERVGWVAETTNRAAVSSLCEVGALVKQTGDGSTRAVITELTPAGVGMLFVADEVEAWLALCPDGAILPDGAAAKGAVKALAGGWSSTLMRVLASRPCTLMELDALIPGVSYPSLERRISWMRGTGQIESLQEEGRGTTYVVTDWLRQAIAPLCAAGRCERRYMDWEGGPVTSVEVEAAFLLAIPLAPLPPRGEGTCMLAVRTDPVRGNGKPHLAGVTVSVDRDGGVSSASDVDGEPSTWAVGSPETWLDFVIDGDIGDLRIGGAEPQLALDLAAGIHIALFGHRTER